ncbi:MAG: glycosyltransferase family 4 protein [Butyrivibrio sp.]|nr:glycosyltransferase family 4 protein [Butyrivibrio sp.]
MRILLLSNYANGIYLFRKELIEAFRDDGHEVTISVPPDENCEKLRGLGFKVVETDLNRHGMNPVADFKLFLSYLGLIKRTKAQVVLTYTVKPNIYGGLAARVMRVPYICNITGLGKAIEKGGVLSRVLILMYRVATSRAQKVFFQNEKNRDVCQKRGVAKKNADLLPGSGVNLTEHPKRDYPDEQSGIRILAVLRIMRDKGVGELLDAAKRISGKYENVHFELVGEYEEDERDNFEPRIKELEDRGILKYYGHIDNVEEVMSKSHIIAHPSYHEGMSNVLLEAAACGRPILASDVSGCREAVIEGKSGFLFEPESADALADAVERILTLSPDERRMMGEAGHEYIKEHFDRQIIIDKYRQELTTEL